MQDLVALKQKHGFYLVVDEAHATFVCGASGGGACQQEGVCQDVSMILFYNYVTCNSHF